MTIHKPVVAVQLLPEKLNMKQGRIFLREIQKCMNIDRPRIVLDCSNVRQLNKSVVHLLLCCLEEALKRNGDVKLAALPPVTGSVVDLTGVSRLFDIYDSTDEAVKSFDQLPVDRVSQPPVPLRSHREPESGD